MRFDIPSSSSLTVILFCLLLLNKAKGQEPSYEHLPSISIGVGYFGELATRPGFVVFSDISLNKSKNQLLTRINFIGYRHKGHTRNFMLLPELVVRRNTKNLNYWEASLGLGTLYQQADSRVYEYQDGSFKNTNIGWFHFAPSLGVRYGRSFKLSNGNLLVPNIGGRVYYQYPFNDFWLLRTAIDLSLSYQLK